MKRFLVIAASLVLATLVSPVVAQSATQEEILTQNPTLAPVPNMDGHWQSTVTGENIAPGYELPADLLPIPGLPDGGWVRDASGEVWPRWTQPGLTTIPRESHLVSGEISSLPFRGEYDGHFTARRELSARGTSFDLSGWNFVRGNNPGDLGIRFPGDPDLRIEGRTDDDGDGSVQDVVVIIPDGTGVSYDQVTCDPGEITWAPHVVYHWTFQLRWEPNSVNPGVCPLTRLRAYTGPYGLGEGSERIIATSVTPLESDDDGSTVELYFQPSPNWVYRTGMVMSPLDGSMVPESGIQLFLDIVDFDDVQGGGVVELEGVWQEAIPVNTLDNLMWASETPSQNFPGTDFDLSGGIDWSAWSLGVLVNRRADGFSLYSPFQNGRQNPPVEDLFGNNPELIYGGFGLRPRVTARTSDLLARTTAECRFALATDAHSTEQRLGSIRLFTALFYQNSGQTDSSFQYGNDYVALPGTGTQPMLNYYELGTGFVLGPNGSDGTPGLLGDRIGGYVALADAVNSAGGNADFTGLHLDVAPASSLP